MYHSFETFSADFTEAVNIEQRRHASVGQKPYFDRKVDINKAWRLYQNSQIPGLNLHLFGRFKPDGIDTSPRNIPIRRTMMQRLFMKRQEFKTAPGFMEQNFGFVNDESIGSIQHMDNAEWDLHVNDAWLLGGVHRGLPFYAASELTVANLFVTLPENSTRKNTVLGITGRELFCLFLAGYKAERGNAKLGTVMVCRDRRLAESLTFKKIETSVDFIDRSIGRDGRDTFKDIAVRAGIII